jgi:peptide/nickel transport system substrate-binding protein
VEGKLYKKTVISKAVFFSLAICLLAVLLLVACQGESPATPTAAKPTTAAGPKYGGILKVSHSSESRDIGYPPGMTSLQDYTPARACLEALGRFDKDSNLQPWLAESWKVDADAKTVTVVLKKGIKFHDGTPFNAAAAKWNIDKFLGDKRGELPAGTKVELIDDNTFRLVLPKWTNTAIIGMGYFAGPMISPTAWQKAGATDKERDDWAFANPVGTGAFQFVSWQKTVKQTYKKFPDYWQKGLPYLDGFEWQIIGDPLVQIASLKAKENDVAHQISVLNANELKKSGGYQIAVIPGVMNSVWYNSAIPTSPFANLKVRQAVSYAVNAKLISDSLYSGMAKSVTQWASPGSYYENPNFKGYPYDPAKAKQLLAEAGYSGLKVKMLTSNTPEYMDFGAALQAMFAQAGMTVEIDAADNLRYRQMTSPGGSFTEMCLASQRGDNDPSMFWPRNLSENGVIMNKTIIHPEEIEKLLVDLDQAVTNEAKRQIGWKLQEVVFGKYCIFTPVIYNVGIDAKLPYVKDDGLAVIVGDEWTPHTAWLDK